MLNRLLIILIIGLVQVQVMAKTVCTVTINSTEEQNIFRKKLEPQGFVFIELLDYASDPKNHSRDWLDKACEAGVECDVLLISGHFGGAFFGKSGFNLSLDRLEEASCNSKCDGILKNPKEVYLMGCNTLRGKETDFRTPEEYYRALVDHDVEPSVATQVVAAASSPLGFSNKDRMQRSFEGVPLIYGFSSVAPSGANVQSTLSQYLDSVPDYAKHLDGVREQTVHPQLFTQFLKMFPVTSTQGLQKKDFFGQEIKHNMCELSKSGQGLIEKLDRVVRLFKSNPFTYIFTLLNVFEQVESYDNKTYTDLKQKLNEFGKDKEFIEKINNILKSNFDFNINLKILSVLKEIEFIDEIKYADQGIKIYIDELSKLSVNSADKICSEVSQLVKLPNILERTLSSMNQFSHRQRLTHSVLRSIECVVAEMKSKKLKVQPLEQINNLLISSISLTQNQFQSTKDPLQTIYSIYALIRLFNFERSQTLKKIMILNQLTIPNAQYSKELKYVRDVVVLSYLPMNQQNRIFQNLLKLSNEEIKKGNFMYYYLFSSMIVESDTIDVNYIKQMIKDYSKYCGEECYLDYSFIEKFKLNNWINELDNKNLYYNSLKNKYNEQGLQKVSFNLQEIKVLVQFISEFESPIKEYFQLNWNKVFSREIILYLIELINNKKIKLSNEFKNTIYEILLKHENIYDLHNLISLKIPMLLEVRRISVEENGSFHIKSETILQSQIIKHTVKN